MAQYSGLYDATSGSPNYNSEVFARFMDLLAVGVISGYENELEVSEGAGLQVIVDSGGQASRGRFYVQSESADGSTPKTLAIDAASTGNLRKDRVVVEYSTTSSTAEVKISKGTESASSPSAPALVNTASVWHESLAIVNIDVGSIDSIEDDRTIKGARSPSVENPFCQLIRETSVQNSGDYVLWNGTKIDPTNMKDATNDEYININETGVYEINVRLNSYYSGTGLWLGNVTINSETSAAVPIDTLIFEYPVQQEAGRTTYQASALLSLAATNKIRIGLGTTLSSNLTITSSLYYTSIEVKKIS